MDLRRLLGTDLPIIQAPMAGVQDSALAIAVSEAGGLGSLPCGMMDPESMRTELRSIITQTSKPYNVNFLCHTMPDPDETREAAWRTLLAPYYQEFDIDPSTVVPPPQRKPFGREVAEVLAEFKPPVVSFHFGLPAPDLVDFVRSWGAIILSTATTVDEAVWLERRGVDAVIAQGLEAGGHRGTFLEDSAGTHDETMTLLSQIVRTVGIPVIAAGGIADARSVAAAFRRGATGVQAGTAYLLCPEATTSSIHRAALQSDGVRQTALTNLFTGRPARGIVNRLMRELGPMHPAAPSYPLAAEALAPLRSRAERQGKGDFSPLWAGQKAGSCRPLPARDVTLALAEGIQE